MSMFTEQQYAEILRFTQSSNDLALAEQVKLFQLAVGLVGDGIAGEKNTNSIKYRIR